MNKGVFHVDGDRSEKSVFKDLSTVIPHLAPVGVLAFDNISHQAHTYFLDIWKSALAEVPYLLGYEFTEMGYGVTLLFGGTNESR